MPVRIAAPAGIGGLVDTILTPGYSTAVGLLQWGAATLGAGEPMRYESAPALGRPRPDPGRAPEHVSLDPRPWRRGAPPWTSEGECRLALRVPVHEDQSSHGPDRVRARAVRPDRRLRAVRRRGGRRGDGLLNVFVPHATAGVVDHRARRGLGRGSAGGARPAPAARRSVAPPARVAGPRRGSRRAAARARRR